MFKQYCNDLSRTSARPGTVQEAGGNCEQKRSPSSKRWQQNERSSHQGGMWDGQTDRGRAPWGGPRLQTWGGVKGHSSGKSASGLCPEGRGGGKGIGELVFMVAAVKGGAERSNLHFNRLLLLGAERVQSGGRDWKPEPRGYPDKRVVSGKHPKSPWRVTQLAGRPHSSACISGLRHCNGPAVGHRRPTRGLRRNPVPSSSCNLLFSSRLLPPS